MIIEERSINDIPALIAYEPRSAPMPLVVLSHGFTRGKEDWRERIPELADRGYFAAALDNRGHGNRRGPDFQTRANRNGQWEVLAIRELIDETAGDIRAVIDGILQSEEIDPERIGLAGVSMGAFAGIKAAVIDPRIKAAVSIIGSPFWDDVFEGTLEEEDPELRARLQAYAARNQPAAFPDRFPPRAVLFLTGEKDPHFNPVRVKEFAIRLGKIYSSTPERVECREFPGIAHEFTPVMWEQALRWFERFL